MIVRHHASRVALLGIVWLLATGGVAFVAGRYAAKSNDAEVSAPLPPVELSQRETVSLDNETISPIVSADGTVVRVGSNWLLEAPATTPDVAYRLLDTPIGVKALIEGGPAGFACAWAGLGQAADGSVTLRCTIPSSVRVAAGMTGTMVVQTAKPREALALPIQAVVGSEGQGEVVVVSGDATSLRSVTLGASDAYWIEITSGLKPGEQVLEYPTQSDFAKAAPS